MKRHVLAFLVGAAMCGGAVGAAHALPVTYTFSGIGTGTFDGAAFSNQVFYLILTGDTSNVQLQSASPDFYRISNIGGTFSEGGSNVTLLPTATIVASDTPNDLINVFNAQFSNGLGGGSDALAAYNLQTSIGPLAPLDPLTPTLGGGSFALVRGGALQFTGDASLAFTAAVGQAVPEPLSLALLTTGLTGLALVRGRRNAG